MKSFIIAAATVAVGLTVLAGSGTVTPASAAFCYYKTFSHEGRQNGIAQGYSNGIKLKNACDRARRECNRRLDRAYRNGKAPRGVTCRRTAHS